MMKNFNKKFLLIFFILFLFFSIKVSFAVKNPAKVYCEALGYKFIIEKTKQGEIGFCEFSENERCPAWLFLVGECGKEYSYCAKNGYQIKTVKDPKKCASLPLGIKCAVCVMKDGKEVEVTKLMNLNFEEGVCGDGKCSLGEYYKTCPQDCPSGSFDRYCDGLSDGVCDPDCLPSMDPDCKKRLNCGNLKCEEGESYRNCPLDCPSGSKDNYCDKIKDNICDPDCKRKEDPDCKSLRVLLWVLLIIIFLVIVFVFYKIIKKKTS